jgi:ATP-dependent Lhr-like helicase
MWPFLFKLPMLEPLQIIQKYFSKKSFKAFAFQEETWNAYLNGKSGLVNAPTGSGKTFSLALPILASGFLSNKKGLKANFNP